MEITKESLMAAGHDAKTAQRIFMYAKKVAENTKKRNEYYATPEGKAYFIEKSKKYYEEHKDIVRAKNRERARLARTAAKTTADKIEQISV